jgi:hypothetical protein
MEYPTVERGYERPPLRRVLPYQATGNTGLSGVPSLGSLVAPIGDMDHRDSRNEASLSHIDSIILQMNSSLWDQLTMFLKESSLTQA